VPAPSALSVAPVAAGNSGDSRQIVLFVDLDLLEQWKHSYHQYHRGSITSTLSMV